MRIDSRKLRNLMESQSCNSKRLAESAGLSRQALHSILRRDCAEVRGKTLSGLVRALNLPDENPLREDSLAGYKADVAKEHAQLDFRGLGLPATEPRSLDDLFVPVRARRVADPKHDKDCRPLSSKEGAGSDEPSLPDDEFGESTVSECLVRHRRLLLRGEPGSGKTTSLWHLARSYARGTQDKNGYPDYSWTPLSIRLADYAKARELDGELSLVRFALASLKREVASDSAALAERALADELRHGNCLVLLDGLDEVGRDHKLPAALRSFIRHFPQNQFVLTSRIVGLDTKPWSRLDFATCDLIRWREDDIRNFTLRWFTSRPGEGGVRKRKENERQADELIAAILGHPSVREIAANPLMLTILAALHHANATLPRRRVDLYAKVAEVLLETWEAGKRAARPGDPLHGIVLEPREFEWLLARLALAMQRQDHVLNPRWWVTEFVQQFLRDTLALGGEQAKDQGDRVIRYLCQRSGLLVERGADVFGFSHRTFQEYFAARGILEEAGAGHEDAVSLVRPYLYHPRWEQVIRLVSAQLAPIQATALVHTILDDPDPVGRFLKRGLRFALRCLADGAVVADRRLLDQIFSDGSAVGESKLLGISLDVIDALLNLKTTRHATDADRMLTDIESAARRALPLKDLVVVYEAIHGALWSPDGGADAPGTVIRKQIGSHHVTIVSLAPRLWREAPQKWYQAVLRLLRSRVSKPPVKLSFIEVLQYEVERNEQVRGALENLLARDRSPEVRAACAWALYRAAALHPSTADRLLRALKHDESDNVRGACAAALQQVAMRQIDVRDHLTAVFNSSATAEVRRGAVRGLYRVALEDRHLFESFVARARSRKESPLVRVACLDVIQEWLGKDPAVDEFLLSCLDDAEAPAVRRVAAQVVAEAVANDGLPWSQDVVAKAEAILMSVTNPCPHTWQALIDLVDAQEIRGGLQLERVLSAALAPLDERISTAMIFGSVARREQHRDSDIDLLLIGDIRLKEVAAALHTAEHALGRVINPALYSVATFRQKYQAGDPFLLQVVRNEKILLKGNSDELRELVAERLSE